LFSDPNGTTAPSFRQVVGRDLTVKRMDPGQKPAGMTSRAMSFLK